MSSCVLIFFGKNNRKTKEKQTTEMVQMKCKKDHFICRESVVKA